eukprot:COSAG01_NODE_9539_length_2415_cov_1.990069_3_plen_104_part_00
MLLSDDDAGHLVRGLAENITLKSLSVAGNRFAWPAGGAFGKYLQDNTSLEELDMSGNELHDNGAFAFREALMSNSTLLYLNMGSCGIQVRHSVTIPKILGSRQ